MQIQIGSAENHVIQTKKLTGFDYYKDFLRDALNFSNLFNFFFLCFFRKLG